MQGPTHVVFDFAKLPCSAVPDTPRTQHKGWEGAGAQASGACAAYLEFACWNYWSTCSANLLAGVTAIIMQRTHAYSSRFKGKK